MISENNLQEKLFPISLLFFIDAVLTACSFILSYALCSYILDDINAHRMLIQLPIVVSITSLIFLFIGIYKGIVSTSRLNEVYSIFNAICLANILTIVLVVVNGKLIMEENLVVPLAIIIVHSILSFTALVASRFLYKNLVVRLIKSYSILKSILLIHDLPTNDTRLELLKGKVFELKKKVMWCLSSSSSNFTKEVLALEVKRKSFDEILVFQGKGISDDLWDTLPSLLNLHKPIFISSEVGFDKNLDSEFLDKKKLFKRLTLEHLFTQRINSEGIFSEFSKEYLGKTILITGAGGGVASELIKELCRSEVNARFILLDNSEAALSEVVTFMKNSKNIEVIPKLLDLKEKKSLEKLFSNYDISLVYHCAGNNAPEGLNENIGKVMHENLLTTKILADIAKRKGVQKFIFCSTSGAECPRTTLEVSKRLAEIYLYSLNTDENTTNFLSLRFNRVYDTNGSGLRYIKNQIEFQKPINRSYFSEHELYTCKKDIARALVFLSTEGFTNENAILTLNCGVSARTHLLADIIYHIYNKDSSNRRKRDVHFINSFKNGPIFTNGKGLSTPRTLSNVFDIEMGPMPDYSKLQIQQRIENLCINLLFDQEDIAIVFDLISNFNSDQWINLFKLRQQDHSNSKIIKLQTNK